MDAKLSDIDPLPPFQVLAPERQSVPLVFSSPHSGKAYPPEFIAASRLDPLNLRRSEDSFVEELFAAAPEYGAPLIHALFPRAYVDPNREPFELDPAMFVDRLPAYANTRSPRVAAGLGTIARVVANGASIYSGKLTFQEALGRIRGHYWPYHTALKELLDETRKRFGYCILVDCHSMPSGGGPGDASAALEGVEIVLGDYHGQSCAGRVTDCAEASLTAQGYRVVRNNPYSGGFVTRHYGQPWEGMHALQIEINRCLYMNEDCIERGPNFEAVRAAMTQLVADMGRLDAGELAA